MQPFKYKPNINAGQLRHRITIQYFVSVKDELGQESESDGNWLDFKQVWADIKTMQGREYFAAAAVQAENTTRFIIRYTPDITSDMRIIYKERVFDIVQPPINDDELFKTLTIITKEGGQIGS
jgi:SPP1 family predicted phage head-tail adaptor